MITVANYHVRENADGEQFIALELQSTNIEMVQSKNTGKFYATARRCFVPSTFSEAVASKMVGQVMPGSIQKVPCEPYHYMIPETGEEITLDYSWQYVPEQSDVSLRQEILEA